MASLTLGGTEYPSKEAAKAYIQSLLANTPVGVQVQGDDKQRVLDLLNMHYQAKDKIGSGVRAIEVRKTEYGSKGFYILRTDGTSTDFSYLKCLDAKPAERKLIDACRYAIQPHIDWYGAYFFKTASNPTCPLTGVPLTKSNAHVDHTPPFTFQRIVDSFCVLCGVSQDDPALVKHGDNLTVPLFASEVMRDRFVSYHMNNAQLRVVSDTANISLVTQSVRAGADRMQ